MTSKAVLSLVCFSMVISSLHAKECDPDLRFNGKQYKEVILDKHTTKTTELVVSPVSGDIFFNEIVPYEKDNVKVKRLKVGESVPETIHGLKGLPVGIAIDEDNDVVYIGASDGIYKFDKESNKAKLYTAGGVDVTSVYYRNNVLYFITRADFHVHKYEKVDGEYKTYGIDIEYADGFIVDSIGNFYYLDQRNVLMKRPHGSTKSVMITGLPNDYSYNPPTAITLTTKNDVLLAIGRKLFIITEGENEAHHLNYYDSPIYAFFMSKNGGLYAADEYNLFKYKCKM